LDLLFPVGETCRKVYFSRSSDHYRAHLPPLKREKVPVVRGRAAPVCGAEGGRPRDGPRRSPWAPVAAGSRQNPSGPRAGDNRSRRGM